MNPDTNIQQIDDEAFLTQFENKTLDPLHFDHVGHLRLAWLHLNSHDVDTAVRLTCSGIQAYATSLGATTKFHLTISDSIVRIMAKRMDLMPEKKWGLFLDQNSDLVEDALSVLHQYFSKDVLFSEEARISLVQSDIRPL
ncbi:MAG: hypothetical protein GY943_34280 [Chloroflexi bacterium]|nr:hypothetical protein [Chloroflexota bacterium]